MKKVLSLILFCVLSSLQAQTSIGIETQAYPAGVVPGIRFDVGLTNNFNITSRIGYNFTDRRDWGEHDNEEGGGPGFSLGVERTGFLTKNLSIHARSDFWFMEIDWEDLRLTPCPPEQFCPQDAQLTFFSGTTSIIVLQPSIGISYIFPLSSQFYIEPSLSFGYEINVKTEGEEVGQGAILLVGIQLGRFLK